MKLMLSQLSTKLKLKLKLKLSLAITSTTKLYNWVVTTVLINHYSFLSDEVTRLEFEVDYLKDELEEKEEEVSYP